MTLNRYSRQMACGAIGRAGQERLASSRVCVLGCGALGTASASLLARAGVGNLRLIDRDFVELHNLQRQSLFSEADAQAGMPKAVAAARRLREINSEIEVEGVVADFNSTNAVRLIEGCDLVLDAVDNFEGRYLLNEVALKAGLPWVHGAVIASYGVTMTVMPGRSACLRCLYPDTPGAGTVDTCDTAGILGPVVTVIAALQATEAMKLLTGALDDLNDGLLQVDVWDGEMRRYPLPRREDCPACVGGQAPYLEATSTSRTTSLCGRDAIQITVAGDERLDLAQLADRLRSVGEILENPFMLRAMIDGYELNIFPDARVIIKGTTDETTARTLYSRYVGL